MTNAWSRVSAEPVARGQAGAGVWGTVEEIVFPSFFVYAFFCVFQLFLGCTPKVAFWLFWCTPVFFRLISSTPKLCVARPLRLVARQTNPRLAWGPRPIGPSPHLPALGVCSFGSLSSATRGFFFTETHDRALASPVAPRLVPCSVRRLRS